MSDDRLPKVKVEKIEYWAVIMYDRFHPDGKEYPKRFETKEAAQAKLERFVSIKLVERLLSE